MEIPADNKDLYNVPKDLRGANTYKKQLTGKRVIFIDVYQNGKILYTKLLKELVRPMTKGKANITILPHGEPYNSTK